MKKPIIFYQGDPRWGNKMFSNHGDKRQTMRATGGAPTLAADIVATLRDPSVTPWDLANLALEKGCRTYLSGTAWSFWPEVAKKYGFSRYVRSGEFSALVDCLNAGGYVICQMKSGYWTPVGNYILAWKYDDEYVYCVMGFKQNRERQPIENFKAESKMFFCFYPEGEYNG